MIPTLVTICIGAVLALISLLGLGWHFELVEKYDKDTFVTIGVLLMLAFTTGCWMFLCGVARYMQ